jgi:signal transduction histidine kinase
MYGIKPKRRIFKSFRARVLTYLIAGMTVIFGCFNIYFYQHEKKHIMSTVLEQGDLLVSVLADTTRLGVFAEDETILRLPMEAVLHHKGILEACLLNKKKDLLLQVMNEEERKSARCLLDKPEQGSQFFNNMFLNKNTIHFEEEDHFEFWAPVVAAKTQPFTAESLFFTDDSELQEQQGGDIIGFAGLTIDKEIYSAQLRDLIYQNLLMGFIFILLSFSVGWLIVQEAASPLQRMIANLRRRGIELKSGDELGALSSTFETLVEELGEAFETINNLKQDLEDKVEERTNSLAKANLELADKQVRLSKTNNQLSEALMELQETQMHMIQSEKMAALGQLVAGVAHEINNTTNFVSGSLPPLSRIINNLNRLLQRYESLDELSDRPAEERENTIESINRFKEEINYDDLMSDLDTLLFNIKEGAGRTTKIVQDLKNFSQPDKGNLQIVDIHKHLDSTVSLLHHEIKHGIEVIKEYDHSLPMVNCYSNQLNQVFMNILLNAIHAVKGKGTILIRTWSESGNLHVLFRDNGYGISKEALSRIFEPFFTLKQVGDGTGLGLSISYSIIKKHHGDIKVRSEIGKGSDFEIVIPLTQKKEDEQTENSIKKTA